MSLREINEQIERELSHEPPMVLRIWVDDEGAVQSKLVPNPECEDIRVSALREVA